MGYNNMNRGVQQQPYRSPQKNSSNKTAVIVSITVLLCVVMIAGTVVFILLHQNSQKDENSSSEPLSSILSSGGDDNNADDNNADQQDGSTKRVLYNTLCKEYVTLRSSTSMESSAVTTIPKGATVEIVNAVRDSTFIHVSYNGYDGYVLSAFFTDSPDAGDKYVMYCGESHYTNLRSQPGSNNEYNIDRILTNEPVQCTGSYEYVDGKKYLECLFKDKIGYVLADAMNYDQKGSTYKGD